MSLADTWNGTDSEEELLPEPYEFEWDDYSTSTALVVLGSPLVIFIGLFLNVLAVVVLLKGRLWLGTGARVYLTAMLVLNSLNLTLGTFTLWLGVLDHSLYIPSTSMTMCRIWPYLDFVIHCTTRWILPVLLLEIYSPDFNANPACRLFLAGSPTRRARRLIGMVVVTASIINLWFAAHPEHLEYNDEHMVCHYRLEWLEQNRLNLIAWRFFYTSLPLYILAPVLFILIIHRRYIRGEFSFRLLEENSDAEDSETARELAVLSLGVAAVMFSFNLPMSISLLYNDLNPDHHSHTQWAVTYLLLELTFVAVPITFLVLSASMRQFVKIRILRKCCCCCGVRLRWLSPGSEDQIRFGNMDQSADGDDDPNANLQPQV